MSTDSVSPIEDTELIVTERGTIYHLDLAPGQLAPTVITVGSPGRVPEVSKHFDTIIHKAQHREFITHTGRIGDKLLSVISTGIGSGNIDIVFNEMDALVNIDFDTRTIKEKKTSLSVVRLGTCGTLQQDIAVDSMIVSSFGLGLDNLLLYYQSVSDLTERHILNEFLRHSGVRSVNASPYVYAASPSLLARFSTGFIKGITATCPGFYAPQGRVLRLTPAFPDMLDHLAAFRCDGDRIVNFEMETAAIYGMGRLLGHNCLSVSAALANRATKSFSKNPELAIETMITQCLEIVAGT